MCVYFVLRGIRASSFVFEMHVLCFFAFDHQYTFLDHLSLLLNDGLSSFRPKTRAFLRGILSESDGQTQTQAELVDTVLVCVRSWQEIWVTSTQILNWVINFGTGSQYPVPATNHCC